MDQKALHAIFAQPVYQAIERVALADRAQVDRHLGFAELNCLLAGVKDQMLVTDLGESLVDFFAGRLSAASFGKAPNLDQRSRGDIKGALRSFTPIDCPLKKRERSGAHGNGFGGRPLIDATDLAIVSIDRQVVFDRVESFQGRQNSIAVSGLVARQHDGELGCHRHAIVKLA